MIAFPFVSRQIPFHFNIVLVVDILEHLSIFSQIPYSCYVLIQRILLPLSDLYAAEVCDIYCIIYFQIGKDSERL